MRGLLIFLGLLLVVGGGAAAGAQFAPMDVAAMPALDPVFNLAPGARDFLKTPEALYAGGGAAGLGLLMIIVAAATGGGKKRARAADRPATAQAPSPKLAPETLAPPPRPTPKAPDPAPKPTPTPQPAAAPSPRPPEAAPKPAPMPVPPATAAAPPPQPAPGAAPRPTPAQAPQPAPAPAPTAKPQASGQPPAAADPRLVNRKRVQDLVTINDALRNYYAKNGVYPKAEGLAGAHERGAAWIPDLSPDFLPSIPRDPEHNGATQYVYVSDGANYKLIAQGASLVGSGNVEVLGIKIDPTRNPTPQNAAFGFWTPPFAGA